MAPPKPPLRSNGPASRVPMLEGDVAPTTPGVGTSLEIAPKSRQSSLSSLRENADGSVEVALDPNESETHEIEEQLDGSAIVREKTEREGSDADKIRDAEFLKNLVEVLPTEVLSPLATDMVAAVERDQEDREERDKKYAEGLKRTGLGDEAPGGAEFPGASRAVHPMLMEACIDFAARTMKEVFPAKGPVKAHIIGTATREKTERAERKKKFMNWQCTRQIREFRPMFEQMLTQLPLGGSQFLKIWYDERFERPRVEFIPIDKLLLPYSASDLRSALRKTHVQEITRVEFESRVDSGLYADVNVGSDSGGAPDKTASEKANDRIEGKADNAYNEDGLRTVYETYCMLEVKGDPLSDGALAPYVMTLDESTGKILALYRNWSEDDAKRREELCWVVEAKFVPWRGAYGASIVQIAGSLAAAATGALRALLDSAHIQNFPGALALKGARMSGQSVTVEPTQIAQIEGPVGIDDIRKLAMPMPFNGPSPTLFQLLEFCVASGKNVINTAEENIADASSQAPVGTTLAMIEQGSITYSSIHGRMHAAMAEVLEILHRIDGEHLEDEDTIAELGELVVRAKDFHGPMDVVPVSDPNIFSETQRYAQLQTAMQLRSQFAPGSFKDNVLLEQALQLINYPRYEDVLNTPLEPIERNALDENVVARDPQSQLEVYENQDHFAHLQAHVRFMASPILCANPLMAPVALPKLMEHCKKHILAYYEEHVEAAVASIMSNTASFPELKTRDAILAAATTLADKEMAKEFGELFPVLQQLQQQMQQIIPQPPAPELAVENMRSKTAEQIEKMRLEAEAAHEGRRAEAEANAEKMRAATEDAAQSRKDAAEFVTQQREAAERATERAAAAASHTEEMAMSAHNAEVAEQSERRKQDMDFILAKMREEFETMRNNSDNQTNIVIERLKAALMEPSAAPSAPPPNRDVEAASRQEGAPASELMFEALASLLRAQTEPRSYAIRRNPLDNSLELQSAPRGA